MHTVTIRPAVPEDTPALLAIYTPYVEHTAITFEYHSPTPDEFAGRIRRTLTRFPYLVAQAGGRPLGYTYAAPFKDRAAYDWAVETSIYVDESARRAGVGRALYHSLERVLAAQHILNLNACIAVPAGEDDPFLTWDSQRFHQRLGYHTVGRFRQCGYKFGRWYDMIWMEKFLGPHPQQPPAVIPFPELGEALDALLNPL